ncbi:MAG: phosphatase PAP2 family protein [Actinomycetota bacterium]|nr:phosphatase PAP2 family protein [Actinomycetota bacterium]
MTEAAGGLLSNTDDFRHVNDFARHSGWLHGPMEAFATYGVVLFGLLLVAGLILARRRGDARLMSGALLACLGMLMAIAANQPLVSAFHKTRPFVAMPQALLLVKHSVDPGFPSDHAVMAGAVAAALFFVSLRLAWTGVVLALVMAFARVYVGVHYPGDVLAGLAVGAVVATVVVVALRRPVTSLVRRLEQTPLRPLLSGPSRAPARV